jgi:hypothetical protein
MQWNGEVNVFFQVHLTKNMISHLLVVQFGPSIHSRLMECERKFVGEPQEENGRRQLWRWWSDFFDVAGSDGFREGPGEWVSRRDTSIGVFEGW